MVEQPVVTPFPCDLQGFAVRVAIVPALLIVGGLGGAAFWAGAEAFDLVAAIGLWVLVIAAATAFVSRRIMDRYERDITALSVGARMLADGRINIDVSGQDRTDPIGDLSRALGFLRHRLLKQQSAAAPVAASASTVPSKAMADALASRKSLDAMLRDAGAVNSSVRETARTLSEQVKRAIGDAHSAREASNQGAIAVSSLAAAVDQIAGAVRRISQQAGESTDLVRKASDAGATAIDHVTQLSQTVQRIGKVVTSIRAIAEQTNLLALNATIEASRAGDAGRGFAVVAAEVKALATETARATSEITTLVARIQDVTAAASAATRGIGQQLEAVDVASRVIAAAVSEQEASTNEIARSSTNAARHSLTAHEHFTGIEQAILAAGTAAADLDGTTARFSETAGRIQAEIDDLIDAVGLAEPPARAA